jgi:hypothetical protein
MAKLYKLTTQDNKTRKGYSNECTWGAGVTHIAKGTGGLCTEGCIHSYLSPELAVIMNPIHANIKAPKLWECKGEIVLSDNGLKVGGKCLTTVREISLPNVTLEQRVIFAILCVKSVFGGKSAEWDKWAEDYISGKNRAAHAAAYDAARAAADAARAADAYPADAYPADAYAAADAARAAAAAARAAHAAAARAAHAAARAADAVAYVAAAAAARAAAARAAAARAAAAYEFDIVDIARQALKMK